MLVQQQLYAQPCAVPSHSYEKIRFRLIPCSTRLLILVSLSLSLSLIETPAVSTFSPASSYELGGVDVVVTGNNFNGGTLYLCKFGDTIVSGRFNNGALTPIPIPAPLPVDQYVDYFEGLLPDDDLKRSVGRRSVLGTGDTITCRAPYHPVDTNTCVDLSISIDGGQTWAYARDRFLYENILGISQQYCNRFVVEEDVQAVSANSASSFAVPMALIAALMFMLLA